MTTYTLADLATRVLKDMGMVGPDETPRAEDQEFAEETCTSEIAMMDAMNIPIWNGSAVSVPEEYLTILSRRIGVSLEPSFGMSSIAQATMAMEAIDKNLRRMAAKPPTGAVAENDYF